MPSYTFSQLKADVNGNIHNKMGLLSNPRNTLNRAVRDVRAIGIRSAKRKSALAPNLFNGIFEYSWPSDADGNMIVGLQPQSQERENDGGYRLTTEEEFDLRKHNEFNLLSFSDNSLVRKLLASVNVDDDSLIVAAMDSLTGDGGTWVLFGDGTNLTTDADNYIKGNGSINWDISAAGGTTAGVQNTGLNTFDLTNYLSAGSAFVWVYLTSATDVTNLILRLGSDSSNYYSMTATTTNSGSAFVAGWNLVRFSFSGKSTTGTPDDDAGDYAAIYMTKAVGKVSETDYRFDHIILKRGVINNLVYYSRYMWQNSSGTYLENSTQDTDYLNCETDEYNLFVEKGTEYAAREAREYDDYKIAQQNFDKMAKEYKRKYKTEALRSTSKYRN